MDIDYLLGSIELPSDHPRWEADLLAELSEPAPISAVPQEQASFTDAQPTRASVILNFMRRATA